MQVVESRWIPRAGTGGLGRRRAATAVTVAATIAVAVALALPWAQSGRSVRSGYALVRLAEALGVAPSFAVLAGLLPFLAAAAWTAAWLGKRWLVAALAAPVGAGAIAVAVLVWRAPVRSGVGPQVAAAAGAVALCGALALVGRRER